MKAIILTGGRGTRLGRLTERLPKPLIKIGSKPILEHQILLLKRYGIDEIFILSGYLGGKIERFLGKNNFGVKIHHLIEDSPLGTAGAVKTLEGKIKDDFIVFSGDVMMDFDIRRLIRFHKKHSPAVGTIIVHPNDHPFDSDLVEVNPNWQVTKFLVRVEKTQPRDLLFKNLTNASVFLFRRTIFKYIKKDEKCDLEKDIFPKILANGEILFAYNTPEYIKDMGSPERLKKVTQDYRSRKIQKLNIANKRKAIFLDRDGTINFDVPFLTKLDDFRLFPFTAGAIKKINASEYLTIVITNQATISMGKLTFEELDKIHKKMETELGWQGAKIDGIYVCPHYPEGGWEGEVKELKIKCSCRKPKTGLIKQAARDFNIDLKKSFYIGDTTIDLETAKNARLKFVGVRTAGRGNKYILKEDKGLLIEKNLLSAVNYILNT